MRSVRARIQLLLFTGIVTAVVVMVVAVIFLRSSLQRQLTSELETLSRGEAGKIATDVYLMCRSMNDQLLLTLRGDLKVAWDEVKRAGGLSQGGGNATWTAVNQFDKSTQEVVLPRMQAGGRWLGQVAAAEQQVPVVDDVQRLVDCTCTIFQRMNPEGDMLRVATNIIKLDGARAIGTYIPAKNPDGSPNEVVATVMSGKAYSGKAFVVNAWYITTYDPIKDSAGNVIGMLFVGIKQESVESLRKGIMDVQVGKSGYVFVLGAKGDQQGKYIISKGGERDGENIWEAKDDDGKFFIQELIAKASATSNGTPDFHQYMWKNKEDKVAKEKIAAVTYFPDWDWVIGAGAYAEDWYDARARVIGALNTTMSVTIILAVVIVLVFLVIGGLQSGAITNPLVQGVGFARAVAAGDLTQQLHSKSHDETGQLIKALQQVGENLRVVVGQVSTAAVSVASSSEELAAGADETGRSAQQVASTIGEVARAVTSVSRDVEEVAAFATAAAEQGKVGMTTADQAASIINRAATSVEATSVVVQALGQKTEQISEFISIITGIADQTNLLALNAAIEAARAGDAGRGFAVVAEEVRKLAEESNHAARNITDLVKAIQGEMDTALTAMERSKQEVDTGAESVSQASAVLAEIVNGVEAIHERIQAISAAAEESAAGSSEVSAAAEQQTASMEEISASAGTLAHLAQDLQELVSHFRI